MLSGKVPFQSRSRDDTAAKIMQRIKGGEFKLKGADWEKVSDEAKRLIKGECYLYMCMILYKNMHQRKQK